MDRRTGGARAEHPANGRTRSIGRFGLERDTGVGHAFTPGFTYRRTLTPNVSFDMARVRLQAGTASPLKLSSIAFGFRIPDAKYYSLHLPVAKAIGDAPMESASRSPRINETLSYQLNGSVKVPRSD